MPISLRVHLQRCEQFGPSAEPPDSNERLLAELNVPPSGTIVIFGAQSDFFATPLVSGPGGHALVYSVELSDAPVVRSPMRQPNGIVKMWHKESGRLPLRDESVDVVLWAFAFRTLGHLGNMLGETRRVLRPGGRLAVLDWIRREENVGPVRDERVSAAMCERCLAAGGFGLIGHRALNASHYLITGRRPAGNAAAKGFTIQFGRHRDQRL